MLARAKSTTPTGFAGGRHPIPPTTPEGGQPTGIITALAVSSPTSVVNTATTETITAADVYGLQNALPPRFQANASWCANLNTLNTLRQFTSPNGSFVFPELRNDPPTLLGRDVYELSNMDGVINAGAENYILAYGEFSPNFTIVDRFPASLEPIVNLFGSHGRPTGQRGMFLWARTGSDVVVPNAFRLLDAT